VQVAPPQLPFGPIEKLTAGVTLPSDWLVESNPWVVYAWFPPALIVALAGEITRWSSGFGVADPELPVPSPTAFKALTV
jgi:hypothetical protein